MNRNEKKYCFLLAIVWLTMAMSQNSVGQNKDQCIGWHDQVNPSKPLALTSDKGEENVLLGMKCLLQLEGKKGNSNIAGATKGSVSNLFGPTSIEVAALYYISYLFYEKWDHADAPFLVSKTDSKLNSRRTVAKAYNAYRKWFQLVREIGLDEARRRRIDPLYESRVSWY